MKNIKNIFVKSPSPQTIQMTMQLPMTETITMREKARVHTTSRVVIDPAAAAAAVVVVVAEAGPHTSEVGNVGMDNLV